MILHWLPWAIGLLIVSGAFIYLICRFIYRRRACWPKEASDNGIRVGKPKVYDNRSLSLMLEQLRDQLRNIQTIDAGAVNASVGTQQGEEQRNLSAATSGHWAALPAKPAAAKKEEKASGPEASKNAADAAHGEDKSAIPATSPLKWGLRAADLLNDQINLSYEIFNLRLLLERALSDRLINGKTKVQAVVGIPISIDPPPYATGCAATVEVRLTVAAGREGPSLVAMFPQQETYNTWGVDRRSFTAAASGAAPAGSLAASASTGSERGYLHRRLDTVAIERESGKEELILAWQFRPPVGEPTVTSGLRQMLSVLALSDADVGTQSFQLKVEVRSSWQRWHVSSQTAGRGVGWRGLWSNRTTHYGVWGDHGSVSVPTTEQVEQDLWPGITSIEWLRVGATKAGVVVTGNNFFAGTTVVMGDTVLGPENGLTIKSERSLQLIVPLSSLLSDGLLNGRYGPSRKLVDTAGSGLQPLRIQSTAIEPAENNQSYRITIWLETVDGKKLDWTRFSELPDPIVTINGEVMPEMLTFSPGDKESNVYGTLRVTARYVSSYSVTVGVRWPFRGDAWSLQYETYERPRAFTASRVRGGTTTSILISGTDFTDDVSVVVNREYKIEPAGPLRRFTRDLLNLELSNDLADQYQQIFLKEKDVPVRMLALAPVNRPPSPSFDLSGEPPQSTHAVGGSVMYAGAGLDQITAVTLEAQPVDFNVHAEGRRLVAIIPGAMIPALGVKELVCTLKDGNVLRAPLLVL